MSAPSLSPGSFNNHNQPSVPSHAIFAIPQGTQAHIPPGKFLQIDQEIYGAGRDDAPVPFGWVRPAGITDNALFAHPWERRSRPSNPPQGFGLVQNYGSYIYQNRPYAPGGGVDAHNIRYA
jgi:hypothetical protein